MKLRIICSIVVILAGCVGVFAQGYRSEAWLEDFAQLKKEMSTHYANLEWAVAERGLDLKQLSAETETKIRDAKSDGEAKIAIDTFLRNFGDGHLRVEWTANGSATTSQATTKICDRLGYRSRDLRPGVDFTALKGYNALDTTESKYIPAGSGTLAGGRKFGVVRIGLFSDEVFPGLCEAAVAEAGLTADSACDDDCENKIHNKTANLYTAALVAQVERLKKEKIDTLLVDLTGNGGGTDVYQPMARTLTAKPLRSPASGFVRHAHWIKQNRDRLADLEAETQKASPAMQKLLKQAVDGARQDLAEAEKPCDISPLWENQKPSCSLVVTFSPSPVSYAKPGELSNTALGSIFFSASRYVYAEGVYSGKLVVLIDPRTASSSEAFASMLHDNGAATIIGYPSLGAGCGYTNGGIPATLKNSGAKVRMPDCVRFRANGSNEINGITPDIVVPWRQNDSPYQRAKRVTDTLINISK